MIRLKPSHRVLAKSAYGFIGFPRCKISYFSQEYQGFYNLFLCCEEKLKSAKWLKDIKSLIISVLDAL